MRYIEIGGYVIPKHCKYGPRPATGVVFDNYEWWSITDRLVKDQREKELAATMRAKEDTKKEISYNMTRNWSNTMASIKTQTEQRMREKTMKTKQEKFNRYNELMKKRAEEKREILANAKRVLNENKDAIKTINSGLMYSMVLEGRRKQIEFKNFLKSEEERKEREYAMKLKKEMEELGPEELQDKIKAKAKRDFLKKGLDEQMAAIKKKKEEEDARECEGQKQDLIKMRMEAEKIEKCNLAEYNYRRQLAMQYKVKPKSRVELEKQRILEEQEEDTINKIYQDFEERFKRERQEREEKLRLEKVLQRIKLSEKLGRELSEIARIRDEKEQAAIAEKEQEALKGEEGKLEKRMQYLADLKKQQKSDREKYEMELYRKKEEQKWALLQTFRTAESNQEKIRAEEKMKQEMQKEFREQYDRQCQEMRDMRAKELEEWLKPLEDEAKERQIVLDYCQEVLDFAKENNLPIYPLVEAIRSVKKTEGIRDVSEQKQEEKEEQKCNPRIEVAGCYCLKD